LDVVRRQYKPANFVVGVSAEGVPTYTKASSGIQSAPGLLVFRYDADLFYANANRFVDDVEKLIDSAPDPIRWLILDAGAVDQIDYSAGIAFSGLLDFLAAKNITFAIARADDSLMSSLREIGADARISPERIFGNLLDAVEAFERESQSSK